MMNFIPSAHICQKINQAAAQHIPFLFVIDYEMKEGLFIEEPMKQKEVLFKFKDVSNDSSSNSSHSNAKIDIRAIDKGEYRNKFEIVQKGLSNREIDVVNLTVKTPIHTSISCKEIFYRSNSPYALYVPHTFVSFSPERFVKIEEGKISCNPIKGTIDTLTPHAEEIIQTDKKEIAEHKATVELIIDELQRVASRVAIERFRYIDRVELRGKSLLQVSSEIGGELPHNYLSRMGDILFSLLPAGSITGSPKAAARKYIVDAEKIARGYYCGVAGYFDGAKLDSTVLIRFIEIENGKLFFRSGGGITSESDWEKEYEEVLNKIYLPIV